MFTILIYHAILILQKIILIEDSIEVIKPFRLNNFGETVGSLSGIIDRVI